MEEYSKDIEKYYRLNESEVIKFYKGILEGHSSRAFITLTKLRDKIVSDQLDNGEHDHLKKACKVLCNLLIRTTNKELVKQLIEEKFAAFLMDELGSERFYKNLDRYKTKVIIRFESILSKMAQFEEFRNEMSNQLHKKNFIMKLKPYLTYSLKYVYFKFHQILMLCQLSTQDSLTERLVF